MGTAKDYPETDLDFVTFFDCLHDMGDPAGAAAHVKQSLKPDGTWMIVEPMAGDRLEDNLNPIGRIYYAASTMVCVPTSLAQEVGAALGAQAGEAKLREVISAGGFSNIRRATETPFNHRFWKHAHEVRAATPPPPAPAAARSAAPAATRSGMPRRWR